MARVNVLDMLYTKDMNPLEFSFESLTANPLLSYLSPQDIYQLYKIATSARLSTKPKEKYKMIDAIVKPRGFRKIASGTNRVAYKHLEDTRIIIKIAIDEIGLKDSHREYRNQFLLKPFVTKVFEVSPCGTVGLFERVYPVQTIHEYMAIASDVFDVINTKIIGKYVVDDIGTEYFQNVGVRKGFGVVYLDFPYVYELDGKKLYCNAKINGFPCCGEIDYDEGFNKLVCTKCGARYFAHQLKKQVQNKEIILRKGRKQKMKFTIMQGDQVVREIKSQAESNVLPVKMDKTSEEKPMKFRKFTGEEVIGKPDQEPVEKVIGTKMRFRFVKEGEDDRKADTAEPASSKPEKSKVEEKANENIKTSDYESEAIGSSYQNKDIVETSKVEEKPVVIIETPTQEEIEAVVSEIKDGESDVITVDSLTILPREGAEYPEDSDNYQDYFNGNESDEEEIPEEVETETKEVIASY